MENASKALVIAGGVLLGILIMGLIVVVANNMTQAQKNQEQLLSAEQVTKFNLQFESYNKKVLRGVDIISVCNKANDYNTRESDDTSKGYTPITITVEIKVGSVPLNFTSQNEFINNYKTKLDEKGITDSEFKQFYFQCTGIEYDPNNGRVIKMHFERVKEY